MSQLDVLCEALYGNSSGEDRASARERLTERYEKDFSGLMDGLVNTASPYTAMYCSLAVVPAFKSSMGDIAATDQDTVFNALFDKLLKITLDPAADPLMSQVRRVLLTSLCRLNKLVLEARSGGSTLLDRCLAMVPPNSDLASAPPEAGVALEVLASFIAEVQLHDSNRTSQFMTFGQHRRASTALRDGPLKDICTYLVQLLQSVRGASAMPPDPVLKGASALAEAVFTYDFMAIIVDETEDMYVTQFPSEWREVISPPTLEVIGWCHLNFAMPHCLGMMRALIGLIGTRRSFYEDEDMKFHWIEFFMQQIIAAENSSDGRLQHTEYCNAMAESIHRFSPPHSYRDLVRCASSRRWFTFAADFTMSVFQVPFGDGGSFATTTTLMQFWSRMSGSKRIALNDETDKPGEDIEQFLPTMVGSFAATRLTQADVDIDADALDSINAQSDLLPGLIALCPEASISALMGPAVEHGAERIASCRSTMIWMCYIAGSLVRHWFTNLKEALVPPASSFLTFAGACVTAYQSSSNRSESDVENGLVYFLTQLQHTFASPRISAPLQKVIETVFDTKTALFQFILDSVGSNMLSTVLEPATIRDSIELIVDACKELPDDQLSALNLNLPPTEQLPLAGHVATYKLRTQLTKALFTVRLPGAPDHRRFCDFMAPTEALMTQGNTDPLFVAGWLRDLRGVASAASSSQSMNAELLDWLIDRNAIFTGLSETSGLPTLVIISFLKFLLQLVQPNFPSSRVNVPAMIHSAAGIHLFQFVSTHVQNIMTNSVMPSPALAEAQNQRVDGERTWPCALKPLQVSMEIVRRCVSGEFCPFGAMQLYGDNRFDVLVSGIVSIVRTLPTNLFKEFNKLGGSLQYMLRTMHEAGMITPFAAMETGDLMALVGLSMSVITDADEKAIITSHALNFLSFVGGLFPEVMRLANGAPSRHHRNSPTRTAFELRETVAKKFLGHSEELWGELVLAAMGVVTTQDRGLSPAASTVFPIFEADPSKWRAYRDYLLPQYPPAKQQRVAELLDNLGGNVSTSETFFSNLVSFRMGIRMV